MRLAFTPTRTALRSMMVASIWPIADQGMVSASNFLTSVVVARCLGIYDFGIFTLGWSGVLLILTLQFSLISAPMFSFAPRLDDAGRSSYFSALLLREAVFVGAAFLILFFCAHLGHVFSPQWPFKAIALPMAVAASLYVLQDFIRRCLFAQGKSAIAFVADIIAYPLQLVALLVEMDRGLSLSELFWIIAATSGLAAAVGFAALPPLRMETAETRKVLAQHWPFSRWIVGSAATSWVVLNAFYISTGLILGAKGVAGLRAASLLFAVGNVVLLGFENFVPTRGAELLHKKGWDAFFKFMVFWMVVGLAMSLAISLGAVAAPRFWLTLAFGANLADAAPLVYGLAIAYPLSVYVSSTAVLVRTAAETRPIFVVGSWMALTALLAAYPAVAVLGLNGAVVGQILCCAVGCWLMTSRVSKLRHGFMPASEQ
jgi:O-antigen/teichoic acid export membrane protein